MADRVYGVIYKGREIDAGVFPGPRVVKKIGVRPASRQQRRSEDCAGTRNVQFGTKSVASLRHWSGLGDCLPGPSQSRISMMKKVVRGPALTTIWARDGGSVATTRP